MRVVSCDAENKTARIPLKADADTFGRTFNQIPTRLISASFRKTNAGLGRLILSLCGDAFDSSGQHERKPKLNY